MNDMAPDHAAALQVTRALRAAGYQAFWAGGCVRDRKLGQLQHADIDIATDAQPDQIRELFGQRRTIAVGDGANALPLICYEIIFPSLVLAGDAALGGQRQAHWVDGQEREGGRLARLR